MKKTKVLLLICFALVLLIGCGAKPNAFTAEVNQDGTLTKMHFEGMGDKTEKIVMTITVDLSEYAAEATPEIMNQIAEETKGEMQSLIGDAKGVTLEVNVDGTSIVQVITIDASTPETIKQLSESGVLELEGVSDSISMKATKEALTKGGYTITEE